MKVILLNGRLDDPHIQGITKELKKIREKFVVLDSFSSTDNFHVKFSKGISEGAIQINSKLINLENVKSIWNTSPLRIKLSPSLKKETINFVRAEWTEGIHSLWNSIDTKWVNHPESILNAVNRLKLLQLGTKTGLKTPKTIVTNNPDTLRNFFEECNGNIIAKTLHSSEGLPEDKMIFTTKISKKDLKMAKQLKYAPCMFQEYIPKDTEFRVTIIGKKIHSAEIQSQKSEKTKHDWRQYDDFKNTPYTKSELPKKVSNSLLKLMKILNLEFGAADLIKTPDNDFVFLEVNPNGRWWWIQELTKMNIAKSIAANLAFNN